MSDVCAVVMTDVCCSSLALVQLYTLICYVLRLQYLLYMSSQQTQATVSTSCEHAACLLCYQIFRWYRYQDTALPCAAALGLPVSDRFVSRNARRTDSTEFPKYNATIQGSAQNHGHSYDLQPRCVCTQTSTHV